MPVQATDIALFLISFAACVYCIVLSRRLRVLQNTKDGLGATIMALSDSIATMSATTQETRLHANDLANRLTGVMQEATRTCRQIDEMTRDLDIRQANRLAEARAAGDELGARVNGLLEDSAARIEELDMLTRQVRTLTDATTETILEAIHRAAANQTQTKPRLVQPHDS